MSAQDKDMEAAAKAYGHRIATPMLRSMWPSMSRGAFADFLACAFGEGWKAVSERKDASLAPGLLKAIELLRGDAAVMAVLNNGSMRREEWANFIEAEATRLGWLKGEKNDGS